MKMQQQKKITRENVFWAFEMQKQKAKQMFFEIFSFIEKELEKTKQNYQNPNQTRLNFKHKLQQCSKPYKAN